jgi:Flp pilus assembly pilin Flp
MSKLKIAELILTAIGLLVTAVKAVFKFIATLGKIPAKPVPA